jgi:hypothetical protein
MVHLSKTAAEISVYPLKIEAAARHLTEQSTVVFSAELVEFCATEATLALAMNRKPSLLAALYGSWVRHLCVNLARTNIVCGKPPELANCGRKGPVHYPLIKLRLFVRWLKEGENSGLLFSRNKRHVKDAAEFGAEPTVVEVRHLPWFAGCQCDLFR